MRTATRFLRFWWEFVIGDDWRIAAAVALALAVTALLSRVGVHVWWLVLTVAAAMLVVSVVTLGRSGGS